MNWIRRIKRGVAQLSLGSSGMPRAGSRRRNTALCRLELVEDRRLLSASPSALTSSELLEPTYQDFVDADVVGRSIFYNHSKFDGNDAGANASDDGAIATDKAVLLTGQTATLNNYTSYYRGINGLMVDIAGLPGTPTASDFVFKAGMSNDPSSWSLAPAPLSIMVRAGAGVQHSDRITIIWADGAIKKTWLQVAVLPTPATGLKTADLFYVGNAVGEAGNSQSSAIVSAVDEILARNHPRNLLNPAPIEFAYDYSRDGIVNAFDQIVARANPSNLLNALPLLTPPTLASAPQYQREQIELFDRNSGDHPIYFAPTLIRSTTGTILAFAEGRLGNTDQTGAAIAMRRSTDGGVNWSLYQTLFTEPDPNNSTTNAGSPVVDEATGEIFFLFNRTGGRIFVISSKDDGLTWSSPREITADVKVSSASSPPGHNFPADPWGWNVVGPGHGIQMKSGPHAGRLLITADHRLTVDNSGPSFTHVIYSDDHGESWKLGGGLNELVASNQYSNEASIVENPGGELYLSIRVNASASRFRAFSRSYDGGLTWTNMQKDFSLPTSPVEGSLLRVNDHVVLFSCLEFSNDGVRKQLTIWGSYDNERTWTRKKVIFFGSAGYSDMVLAGPDTVLVAYARGHASGGQTSYAKIGLARFNLRWLENSDPYEFSWYFNDAPVGTPANTFGTSIQDYGPWDARAQAVSADNPPVYIAAPNGDEALSLTEGSDYVRLSPTGPRQLQFPPGQSFTAQFVIRTSDADGVLAGTLPNAAGWTVKIVGGKVQASITDLAATSTVTGEQPINDGAWHHIAVVHDGFAPKLTLYIDRQKVAETDVTTTDITFSYEPVALGAYNDATEQLAVDVDIVRVTCAALNPSSFLPPDFVSPQPPPPATYASNAPTSIPGLKFWLPPYDPAHYFADENHSDPLPLRPTTSVSPTSALSLTNESAVPFAAVSRDVFYDSDAVIGPYWRHQPATTNTAALWTVQNSNGTKPDNFDFIQNTGRFTISTFVKVDSFFAPVALFDTNNGTSELPGFILLLQSNGSLNVTITGKDGLARYGQQSPSATIKPGTWYHLAAVGSGPGQPVAYYVTPVSASDVVGFSLPGVLAGPDGNYPTDTNHDLTIGGRSAIGDRVLRGGMVNQAIYDRPLSPAEIQQLFDFGKENGHTPS